jgi:RNA polymerase sigma-70 factor (ECF subfamily)
VVTTQQIVNDCRRGERAAQRALYDLTAERIHRLLLRMLRNADDAADIMQDTYVRVFGRIGQFHEGSDIATWVYRIAVNEALQFLRKRRRREQLAEAVAARGPTSGAGEMQVEMRDALDQLPDDERTLLVLKYYENMNYAEMAQVLERPAGTIASGLNRARHMLREFLESPSQGGPSEETTESHHPIKGG